LDRSHDILVEQFDLRMEGEPRVTLWQAVVDEHGSLVWRLACRLLGNEHDAADCYQTVFFEAFYVSQRKRIHNWPGFLTRLVTTRGIDLLRSRKRYLEADAQASLDKAATLAASPQDIAQGRELTRRLREALTQLPTEQAQVFCLRYFEQMSNQEIAVQLATNANHIGVLLHRAREALRERLDDITRAD
jgi:RNA polymerase sigma-70 factor, ECF subfamily